MRVHTYHEATGTNSTRRPGQVVQQNINFEVFHGFHKGRVLNSTPDKYEPVRPGFKPYLTQHGELIGIQD